jgi:hypothetical protein
MAHKWRNLFIGIILTFLLLALPSAFFSAEKEDTMQELKSSYLQSIYDDCRIFLEGIELFIRRDYPKFWQNIQDDQTMPLEEVEKYTKELKHFEGQLDALFEEFITFKNTSGNTDENGATFSNKLELQIYQMLAYSYMKTGDFAMSYDLLQNKNIFSQNFSIKLIDIEGRLTDFPLTAELKNMFKMVSGNLTFLSIRTKYFFPSDIQSINAYLRIPAYDKESPFNKAYFSYYKETFVGLGQSKENSIHFSEIINFFNRRNYKNLSRNTGPVSTDKNQYIQTYKFPIIKGGYDLDLKDRTILGSVSADNKTINLERLCVFKGFAVTDFKRLKSDEMKNVKNDTIIDKGLNLVKTDLLSDETDIMASSGKDTKKRMLLDHELGKTENIKKGTMLRYDVYQLFEQGKFLGLVELVPCYKGEDCKKRSIDKSITKVNVYNHELIFYQDILDAVQSNRKMYSKGDLSSVNDGSPAPNVKPGNRPKEKMTSPLEVAMNETKPEKVHVGRGCASGK